MCSMNACAAWPAILLKWTCTVSSPMALHSLIRTVPYTSVLQKDPCKCNPELIIPMIIRPLGNICVFFFSQAFLSECCCFCSQIRFPRQYTLLSVSCSFFLFQRSVLDYMVSRVGLWSWVVFNTRTLVILENTSDVSFHCPPPQSDTVKWLILIFLLLLCIWFVDISLTETLDQCFSMRTSAVLVSLLKM